jgi:hypothetical protein
VHCNSCLGLPAHPVIIKELKSTTQNMIITLTWNNTTCSRSLVAQVGHTVLTNWSRLHHHVSLQTFPFSPISIPSRASFCLAIWKWWEVIFVVRTLIINYYYFVIQLLKGVDFGNMLSVNNAIKWFKYTYTCTWGSTLLWSPMQMLKVESPSLFLTAYWTKWIIFQDDPEI